MVEVVHRSESAGVTVELALATGEPAGPGQPHPYTYVPLATPGRGWTTTTVRLTGLSGTVRALGVRLTGTGGPVTWRLGSLAVRDKAAQNPSAPAGLRITAAAGGDLRFAWQPAPGAVRHHTLHRVLPDGTRRFLGATCQRAYFVPGLRPEQGESAARFELRAVGELYTASTPVTATHPW